MQFYVFARGIWRVYVQSFGRKTVKERDHIEAIGIDVSVILIWV